MMKGVPKPDPKPYRIYVLTDASGTKRYVGMTGHDLDHRLMGHRYCLKQVAQSRCNGITMHKAMAKVGATFDGWTIALLEELVGTRQQACDAEACWLATLLAEGHPLLNARKRTDGRKRRRNGR